MDPADIRAFVQRDWQRLREYKERAWEHVKATRGPTVAVLAADALRLVAHEHHPEWPSETDRRVDLETHVRVSHALRSVSWP